MQLTALQKKVLTIALVSLIVHFALTATYAHTFDYEYWMMVMQNIETGNDLYGLDAYYYTPVWGYLLSFCDIVIEASGTIPQWGDMFVELLPTEHSPVATQAILVSPPMNFVIKAALSVCDLFCGYVIFLLVKEHTGDARKGLVGMAMWCFNPIIIYMSAGQGQFDNISTLLILVCVLLLRKKSYVFAGTALALATWLKIFGGFCALLLVAYLFARRKSDETAAKGIAVSVISFAVTSGVLFAPVVANGELELAFSFLTGRTMIMDSAGLALFYAKIALVLLTMVMLAVSMARKTPEKAERSLLFYMGATVVAVTVILPGYQYAASVLAFFIFFALLPEGEICRRSGWALYAVLTTVMTLIGFMFMGPAGLSIISAYFGAVDLDTLCRWITAFLGSSFRLRLHALCDGTLNAVLLICTIGTWIWVFRERLGRLWNRIVPTSGEGLR